MARRKPIDLARVRAAVGALRALVKAHPHLAGESGSNNRAGWESVLEKDAAMATKMTAFRLPEELLARLDAHADRLAKATGLAVTRVDVVKLLLARGLDAVEKEPGAGKRRK